MSFAVVGTEPALPWPLNRWRWWTEPVRAERLAALRIGLGLVLLFDVVVTYLPFADEFFGVLGAPDVFARSSNDFWSPAWALPPWRGYVGPWFVLVWAAAALSLSLGLWSRLSAFACWWLGLTAMSLNPALCNAGDIVRNVVLFYLMLSPCGAVWSLDALSAGRRGAVYVWPWPLRLLFVQLVCAYGFNGLNKLFGSGWVEGDAVYYAQASVEWGRFAFALWPVRDAAVLRALTWVVLAWEVLFPLLVLWRPTRLAALAMGVLFHVGLAVALEVGMFAPYMLTLYLPLVPWERWGGSAVLVLDPRPDR